MNVVLLALQLKIIACKALIELLRVNMFYSNQITSNVNELSVTCVVNIDDQIIE